MGLTRDGDGSGRSQDPARTRGRRWAVPVVAALGVLLLLAGFTVNRRAPLAPGRVTVFAASSLQDVLLEARRNFEAAHPGIRLHFNFAGSQVLRVQLAQGARADLYAPADEVQMAVAEGEGLIDGRIQVLARGRLVVIVPAGNPGGVQHLSDLDRVGLKLVLAHEGVPAGRYARQVLERATGEPAYGAGFAERVMAQVVSLETNVRQVVAKVRLGEADAGVVYATDVTPSVREELRVIEIPPSIAVEVRYPIALVQGASNPGGGEAFMSYLLSEEGQAVLQSFGFLAGARDRG